MTDIQSFDPNGVGQLDANIFGLPFTEETAQIILIPVPWEVTVSYRTGTATGPEGIFKESYQVDLYDPEYTDKWKQGYYMLPINETIHSKSNQLRKYADQIISHLENGSPAAQQDAINTLQTEINKESSLLNEWVYNTAKRFINKGKKVALIGGDHSTPLGIIKALAEHHETIGVLQIDAHADLREAYEGFTYSHASIMYNVLQEIPQVTQLTQVGIRDYCDEELEVIHSQPNRIKTFFDRDIKNKQYEGTTWSTIVQEIIKTLPPKIYISFDIDGLDPKLCPNTGTPVPGGFEMEQVNYLFTKIKEAGIEIIGFDVNEVSTGKDENSNTIDLISGARLIYKLCNHLAS